ncbi:MAG: sugar transferase [Nitrospira sp.]|nr:sugar transferase [Nitrospira sp.]
MTTTVVLEEDLFKDTITRERKRTERSGLSMALLLVGVQDGSSDRSEVRSSLVEVLSELGSETDLIGWFEGRTLLGLLVIDVDPAQLEQVCERVEADCRRALSARIGQAAEDISLRMRVYPEACQVGEEGYDEDPFLFPELPARRQAAASFHMVKRCFDIVASGVLLAVLSPLFLVIACLVKLSSPGPVIFRQTRVGQGMKPFMMCKFRSMYANNDHGIHQNYVSWFINSSDKAPAKDKGQVFKLTSDPRITPIGHFLRKSSLDELPQLCNVFCGEMSLVGPRPPLWYELQQYKPWHRHRVLEAKPGITGLWQVTGRSRTTFDEMVRLDLRYARAQSFWTDIKILLATPAEVIRGKGAC